MNRIERAVIMAAGIGSRMHPVTLDTPKPLVRVNGVRLIDTILQALYANNIKEIYIVVGYLKEQFAELKHDYPDITFINNPCYADCNNISSLYAAREHLENVMILDGDQMICNPDILSPEFERSCYSCIWTEQETKEWLLTVENGTIQSCSRTGGTRGWQLCSISRWTAADGQRLKQHLEYEFEINKSRQLYWDDIALFCYPEEYALGIREMSPQDVLEIDTLSELAALDASYGSYLPRHQLLRNEE